MLKIDRIIKTLSMSKKAKENIIRYKEFEAKHNLVGFYNKF